MARAAEEMPSIEDVSEDPVDDDWAARFFTSAQDVSDPELQLRWSKILARETATPGATSLRTLEVLKNLSASEARLFEESIRDVCETGGDLLFVHAKNSLPWEKSDLLTECGLFGASFPFGVPDGCRFELTHGGIRLVLLPRPTHMKLSRLVQVMRLTEAGKSIARICRHPLEPNRQFLIGLLKQHAKRFEIEVQYPDSTIPLVEYLGDLGAVDDGEAGESEES